MNWVGRERRERRLTGLTAERRLVMVVPEAFDAVDDRAEVVIACPLHGPRLQTVAARARERTCVRVADAEQQDGDGQGGGSQQWVPKDATGCSGATSTRRPVLRTRREATVWWRSLDPARQQRVDHERCGPVVRNRITHREPWSRRYVPRTCREGHRPAFYAGSQEC